MGWNLGDVLDEVGRIIDPARPALIHGERTIAWGELTQRSNRLARAFLGTGAGAGDKVAFYMRNGTAYSETFAACLKARLAHVNVNYRYQREELYYIFDDSDARVLVYDGEFRDQIAALADRLTKVRLFVEVTSDGPAADFAVSFETLAETGDDTSLDIARSSGDEMLIYTGGTTGMPKGVVWAAGDFYAAILEVSKLFGPVPADQPELLARLRDEGPGPVSLPACPLMHGTGFASMMGALAGGGTLVTLESASFDASEVWHTVARHKVERMSIVGDAFARPMVEALENGIGALDLSSLALITSSGIIWSTEIKRRLLAQLPQLVLFDSFGASEGVGFGNSIMSGEGEATTGQFAISDLAKVFDDDGSEVVPGSGQEGWLAVGGPLPLGYYKDAAKSATVFRVFDGKRYSVPGDRCLVEADGTIIFLGRGSVCINTGGEKVFPEEIEEVLKKHASVEDVLVVGVPDEKWGQAVTAVACPRAGRGLDEEALRDHVRAHLAAYKIPKRVLTAGLPLRAANGKPDYAAARDFAIAALAGD